LAEFIAYARANPGKINMASAGIGSGNHVFGELFKSMIGVNLVHVPYRGAAPPLVDLLGGKTQGMFAPASILIEHIRAGRLRALGVLTATRSRSFPTSPRWPSSCQAMRPATGPASARRDAGRDPLRASTGKSMRHSPIPRSRHGSRRSM